MFADGDTPVFLTRLGLTSDTDKQAVRRAYSHELKQIDQETDAASFQALREAYDAALAWLDRGPVGNVNNATVPDLRPRQAAVRFRSAPPSSIQLQQNPEDAAQLAAAVFANFEDVCGRLSTSLHAQEEFYWEAALERHRTDSRLINLEARTMFESLLARRLAAGWAPGNKTLLVAAAKLFGWMADRRALRLLGHSGFLVNQALEEYLMYAAQPADEILVQGEILQRLSDQETPDDLQLSIDMPFLELMLLRFPTWLPMVVDERTINVWRRIHLANFGMEIGVEKDRHAKLIERYRQPALSLREICLTLLLMVAAFVALLLIRTPTS